MKRLSKLGLDFDGGVVNDEGMCVCRVGVEYEGVKGFGWADCPIDPDLLDAFREAGGSEAKYILDDAKFYIEGIEDRVKKEAI